MDIRLFVERHCFTHFYEPYGMRLISVKKEREVLAYNLRKYSEGKMT
jgi:hypothetical protein